MDLKMTSRPDFDYLYPKLSTNGQYRCLLTFPKCGVGILALSGSCPALGRGRSDSDEIERP
jgi:hypothetical protein